MSKFKNIFVLILITVFAVGFFSFPFIIKVKIDCKSQYGACPSDLNAKLQMLNDKSLFQARRESKMFLKESNLVSDFSFQFKLPNILMINILIKKPIFAIRNDSNQAELIGEDGQVLEIADNKSLPSLIITGSLKKVGETIDSNHIFALKLIQGVNDIYQINNGVLANEGLLVELPTSIKVIFPMDGDVQILLGSLRVVYTKIESNDQKGKYREIDLRFKNPVLR